MVWQLILHIHVFIQTVFRTMDKEVLYDDDTAFLNIHLEILFYAMKMIGDPLRV